MQPITSPNSKRFKDAFQLHRSRGRKKQDRIIIFGWREVLRSIESGVRPDEIFLCDRGMQAPPLEKLRTMLASQSRSEDCLYRLADDLFKSLSYGDRPDGVIMTARRPSTNLASLDEKIDGSGSNSLIVICERLENPGNLGGLVRSADGSGTAAVIVADALTDAFHPNAIRNSAGAVFSTPVATASVGDVQAWLIERGYRILVASPDAKDALYAQDLSCKAAVVLGNEAAGVSEQWRLATVEQFRLPMLGVADSLNVSVTGAIVMYEALRQNGR